MLSNQFSGRLHLLRWVIPVTLALLVAAYQLILARWIQATFGEQYHTLAEILFYGTLGPLLAYFLLDFLIRWLEERETSELQAQILENTRAHAAASRSLSDEALQTFYAVSILLDSLERSLPKEIPGEAAARLKEAEEAVDRTMAKLRAHLQMPPEKQVRMGSSSPNVTQHKPVP